MSNDAVAKLQQVQVEALKELVTARNAIVAKINAAQGDKDAIAEGVLNSDDDPRVVELRVKLAEVQDALDVIVDEKVKEIMATGAEDVEGLKEKVAEEDKTIRSGILYFKKLYGDEAAKQLPKLDRLKGARSGGSGGKRIRGYDVVVTMANGESTQFENFASAAKHLDTDTASLQEQFFAKAGVEKLKDAPDEVEFRLEWEEEEEDGSKSTNSAVVKAIRTGPSGVPDSNGDDSDDEEAEAEAEVELDEDELESI